MSYLPPIVGTTSPDEDDSEIAFFLSLPISDSNKIRGWLHFTGASDESDINEYVVYEVDPNDYSTIGNPIASISKSEATSGLFKYHLYIPNTLYNGQQLMFGVFGVRSNLPDTLVHKNFEVKTYMYNNFHHFTQLYLKVQYSLDRISIASLIKLIGKEPILQSSLFDNSPEFTLNDFNFLLSLIEPVGTIIAID